MRQELTLAKFGFWLAGSLAILTAGAAFGLNSPSQFCTGDPCVITGTKNADEGITLDFGTRAVVLNGQINIGDLPSGSVGSLTILAGSFGMGSDGQINGAGGSDNAGTVTIQTTGDIHIDGTRSTGAFRLTGTDAGTVNLTSTGGSVYGVGKFNLDRDGLLSSGGNLTVSAAGVVLLQGDIIASGGSQGSGGYINISAAGDVTLSGLVNVNGGESGGGELDVTAGGNVTLGPVQMDGGADSGDAGYCDITANGDILVNGAMRGQGADNGESCGDGACVSFDAGGNVVINQQIDVRGYGLDCDGGELDIFGVDVHMNADMLFSGTGTEGGGGSLDVTADGVITSSGLIAVDGGEGGAGDISYLADGDISLGGTIDGHGRTANSPGVLLIDVDAGGTLSVTGDIYVPGGSASDGGDVLLSGCTVTIAATTDIDASGLDGEISIAGNDSITVRGHYTVDPATGTMEIVHGPATSPIDVTGAVFNIPPVYTLDAYLVPCVACASNAECADSNPCTDDICDPSTGCSNVPNDALCDDANVCTTDSCDVNLGCLHPANTLPCDDGDACTTGDVCAAGSCSPGPPTDCDDADVCTADSCDALVGCRHDPIVGCMDSDGDGTLDSEDECSTLAWSATPTLPPDQNPSKLKLGMKKLAGAPGQAGILLKGLFNPAGLSPAIDPSTNGVNLRIADSGGVVYDVNVPGGLIGSGTCGSSDGWKVAGAATKRTWKYVNKSGALPPGCAAGSAKGVSSILIKDQRNSSKAAFFVKAKAKGATLEQALVNPATRLQVDLALGARPDAVSASPQAIAGQCAEAVFSGSPIPSSAPKPFCKFKLLGATIDAVSCKGP
jgi:Dictyostelium (slime mold) repeat/Haemagglutinin repeat